MRRTPAWALALLLTLLIGRPAASGEPAGVSEADRLRGAALDLLLERQRTLLALHEPIRLAAAALCRDKLVPVLGAFSLSKEELPESLQEFGAKRLHLKGGAVRVIQVLEGYAGQRGGLREGDRIVAAAGHRLTTGFRLESLPSGSLGESFSVTVQRGDTEVVLDIPVDLGCLSPARVIPMDPVNAGMTDAGVLLVTSGMMRRYPDRNTLSLIIGHEIAHKVLGHPYSRPLYELDADYLGAYIAARAGADIAVAPRIWKEWSIDMPFTLDDRVRNSHPGSPERALALEATVKEIQDKMARGQPLVPELER